MEQVENKTKPEDDFFDENENEFVPCSKCDGHPACEDFGCAFELGLWKMVKRDPYLGNRDDWD